MNDAGLTAAGPVFFGSRRDRVLPPGLAVLLGATGGLSAPAMAQCRIDVTAHPTDATVCPTGSAEFSVSAEGDGPFSYRWQVLIGDAWVTIGHDPLPLSCGGFAYAIPPMDRTTRIGIRPCEGVLAYQIRCLISNTCTDATSRQATYSICRADFNCDGSVDFFDYLGFVGAFDADGVGADFNHDGTIDFFDYLDFAEAFVAGC